MEQSKYIKKCRYWYKNQNNREWKWRHNISMRENCHKNYYKMVDQISFLLVNIVR